MICVVFLMGRIYFFWLVGTLFLLFGPKKNPLKNGCDGFSVEGPVQLEALSSQRLSQGVRTVDRQEPSADDPAGGGRVPGAVGGPSRRCGEGIRRAAAAELPGDRRDVHNGVRLARGRGAVRAGHPADAGGDRRDLRGGL